MYLAKHEILAVRMKHNLFKVQKVYNFQYSCPTDFKQVCECYIIIVYVILLNTTKEKTQVLI